MALSLVFSKSFILCILREFAIKYYKINIFSFISQNWMSFVMCRNMWSFQQNNYSSLSNIFSNMSGFGGDLKIIIQEYSKEEKMKISMEFIFKDIKDLWGFEGIIIL